MIDRKDEFLGEPMSLCERADEFLGEPMNFWENLGAHSSLCSEIRELRMIGLFQSWGRGGDSSQKDRIPFFTMKKICSHVKNL